MSEVSYEDLIMEISGRFAKANIPMAVQLEITKQCNLDCVHCYVDHELHDTQLTFKEIKSLLDELAELGVLQLTITGGEAMTRPDFWEIIEYGKEKGFYLRLLTSGTLLTQKDAARLKKLAIGQVHISLYSANPKTHEAITNRKGSFEKSLKALRLLKDEGVEVLVKSVVLKQNRDDLLQLANLCKSLDCSLRIDTNITPAENAVRDPLSMRLSAAELKEFLADPKHFELIVANGDSEYACSWFERVETSGTVCDVGISSAVIDAYGKVQPCALYPAIDNIRQRSFREIWQKNETIKKLRAINYEDRTECVSCEVLPYCTPCAAFSKLENNDDLSCSKACRIHAEAFRELVAKNKKSPAK